MNLSFTDEQNLLRDSVSKFCGSDYDFETRMKSVNSDLGHNKDHWRLFAELGWLAIPFPEEMGGLDGGDVDLSLMFEEFGKSIVVEPYLANVVLAHARSCCAMPWSLLPVAVGRVTSYH